MHCCVPLCSSRTGRTNKGGQLPKISFHKVPKDPKLLKQFAQRIRRDLGPNFTVTKNTVICSKHYNVVDFYVYNPPSGKRELRPGVLPSVFDFRPKPNSSRKPPVQRSPPSEALSDSETLFLDEHAIDDWAELSDAADDPLSINSSDLLAANSRDPLAIKSSDPLQVPSEPHTTNTQLTVNELLSGLRDEGGVSKFGKVKWGF